jgi:protein-S-isoprenylcysteine O-methyltransferase Ste14
MPDTKRDIPGLPFPPPLLYAAPLLLGLWLQHRAPKPFLPPIVALPLGIFCIALGTIGFVAILAFRRAGTSPNPWRPTTAMVTGGPYRLSRNPMYLGFTLLYLGAACWANSLWLLLFLPVILALMQQLVILREERYLERRFGAEYVGYRNRVRRWI